MPKSSPPIRRQASAPSVQVRPLQDPLDLNLDVGQAAEALLNLARRIPRTPESTVPRLFEVGRQVAVTTAIEALLDAAAERSADLKTIAVALRFRGPDVVDAVLRRLHGAKEVSERRVFFSIAITLGGFEEIRPALVAALTGDLESRQWYVARNSIVLLSTLGAGVPSQQWMTLAAAAHRQVRLALAQDLTRRLGQPGVVDVLAFLLHDTDASIRFTAAVALASCAEPRARGLLARHVLTETDHETAAACRAALSRRSSKRLTA